MNRRRMYEEAVLEKIAHLDVIGDAYEQGYQDAMVKIAEEYEEPSSLGSKALKVGVGALGLYGAHKGLRRLSHGYENWQAGARQGLSDKIRGAGNWLGEKVKSGPGIAPPPAPKNP